MINTINTTENNIWDQMILNERRLEAERQGLSLREFEEVEALQTAIDISLQDTHLDEEINQNIEKSKDIKDELIEDDIETFIATNSFSDPLQLSETLCSSIEEDEEKCIWLQLPIELVQKILILLGDIDMLGYLRMVSKTNNPFIPNEFVYKSICEQIFLRQCPGKKLNIDRWKTWRNMAIYRPRLRTNGFYCLRTTYTRAPNNDNFWEEKKLESIEVRFYRHMRFFNDGYVLYSMDIIDPYDIDKLLKQSIPIYKRVYEGCYSFSGRGEVIVEVILHYCVMRFKLKIMDGDDGYIGKHNMLKLIEHSSIVLSSSQRAWYNSQQPSKFVSKNSVKTNNLYPRGYHHGLLLADTNDSLEQNRVFYKLPETADLRFFRHWDWNP